MRGIDISHHQGNFNVAGVDAEFVICKATEGNGYTDPRFSQFAPAIKQAGRLRGMYHFARADLNPGTAGARREAAWFAKTVEPYVDGETLLVLDWEAGSVKHGPAWAKTWLEEVEHLTGVRPVLYTYHAVVEAYDWSGLTKYPLWYARYPSSKRSPYRSVAQPTVKHWGKPIIWQYTSSGDLPGHTGRLDLNQAYITATEWRRLGGQKGTSVPQMVSPAEGRVSSEYSKRRVHPVTGKITEHWGMDIANAIGTPIYAMYAGTVEAVGEGDIPYRTGKYVKIKNPDGERQLYNHIHRARVKVGDKVAAGDLIADMGATGNVTGPHLHLETWANASHLSHRDPRLDFEHFGITPGSKPTVDEGDWFDMTKKDLEDAIWNVLGSHNINISGATKRALGVDQRSTFALLRYAAAALFENREQHADLATQNKALTAAVEALATSQGMEPIDVTDAVNKAVADALADLKITLAVDKQEDLED